MNRHRRNWSAMGGSRFELEDSLDQRIQEREKIYGEFETALKGEFERLVKEYCKGDLVHIDSLMDYGLQVLIKNYR